MNSQPPADFEPTAVHALVISADGRWEERTISTSLGAYQRIIGGYVAIYRPHQDWHLYCHEVTGMSEPTAVPRNELATALAGRADPSFDVALHGTVVVVGTGPVGQDIDVPDDVARWLTELR